MNSNPERVAWLAIGAALANKQLLARLKTCHANAFRSDPQLRRLFAAMSGDKSAVATALAAIGVSVQPGQTVADAIVDEQLTAGRKARDKSIATKIQTAVATGADLESVLETHLATLLADHATAAKVG